MTREAHEMRGERVVDNGEEIQNWRKDAKKNGKRERYGKKWERQGKKEKKRR